MTAKVVDASAFAATVFLEKETDEIRARFADHQLCAPFLLHFEMANICRKKIRLHPTDEAVIFKQFVSSQAIPIQTLDVDFPEVVTLALKLNLSTYDASYLWLARNLGAELITLDKQLEKAAAKI